ncbi:hypothetical protein BAWI5_26520 [Bacillus wiedmannii]|uniref:NAD-dependent epimerase/dehydratase family protein n=1 Tax=Bacillus wiedmannii TaxID=1890302 RepID=UPI0026877A8E
MPVFILSGAGYIGSHVVMQLIIDGYEVAVIDNLLTGHIESLHEKARLYEGGIDVIRNSCMKSSLKKRKLKV